MILLPDPTNRMTPYRKSMIVLALHRGETTRADVLSTYGLSEDELTGWERRFADHGQQGLAVTKLQIVGHDAERLRLAALRRRLKIARQLKGMVHG